MCGIIGMHEKKAAMKGLLKMSYRGPDAQRIITQDNFSIGSNLLAINSFVRQPFKGKGVMAANCEIYNWRELSARFQLKAENDAELMFRLIERIGFRKALKYLDGPYAVAYLLKGRVHLARDILGIKPLWHAPDFSFASERKVLESLGKASRELNPRAIAEFDLKTGRSNFRRRQFFRAKEEIKAGKEEIKARLWALLTAAVAKRVPDRKFGILFSGGIDSTAIAFIAKSLGLKPVLYTAAMVEPGLRKPEDLSWAKDAAGWLGLKLKTRTVSLKEVPGLIREVIRTIESSDTIKVGVALPFFLSCRMARKDGIRVMYSGLGSEEIFAGYQRHRESEDINRECRRGLLMMHKRDNYRDDLVSMANSVELRHPFLDHELIRFALRIPPRYKLRGDALKLILREAALENGMPARFAMRKKRAAQYGSNFDKAIEKLARRAGTTKKDYLSKSL